MSTTFFGQTPIDMTNPFNWDAFLGAIASSSHSATSWSATNSATGGKWQFTGIGFGSYQSNIPFSGTITGITYSVNGVTVFSVSGASADVFTFLSAGVNGDHMTAVAGLYPDSETITGTNAADHLEGFAGNDTLNGAGGDDIIGGGSGTNILNGGDGNDTIYTSSVTDTIDGGNGTDVLSFDGSTATSGTAFVFPAATSNIESLMVWGSGFSDSATIAGSSLYSGWFNAGGGDDTLIYDLSSSTLAISSTLVQALTDGIVTFSTTAVEHFNITGGSGNDNLVGISSSDVLQGGAGDDGLDGQGGNDTLNGGDGNDWIQSGGGIDTIDGGNGVDTALINLSAETAGITVTAATLAAGFTFTDGAAVRNVERLADSTFTGGDDVVDLRGGTAFLFPNSAYNGGGGINTLYADFSGGSGVIQLVGGGLGNAGLSTPTFHAMFTGFRFNVVGGSGDDWLSATSGNDILSGGDGNDLIGSGANGANVLNGGAGDDTISSSASSGDTIDGGAGNDLLNLGLSAGMTLNLGTLGASDLAVGAFHATGIEKYNIVLSNGNDTIILNNIVGNGHRLESTYSYNDKLIADFSALNVQVNVGRSSSANDFNLSTVNGSTELHNFEVMEIHGGSANDNISAGTGNDLLYGNDGDDFLDGGTSISAVYGGAGVNQLYGGGGNDWLQGTSADVLDGGDGVDMAMIFADTTSVGVRYDQALLASAAGQTFAAGGVARNIERFTIWAGTGDDSMELDASHLHGDNTFYGGGGTDSLVLDCSMLTTALNSAIGWISGADFVLNHGVEFITVYATNGDDTVYGSGALYGNDGADQLNGLFDNDRLYGGAGNDILFDYAGDDILDGGAGADRMLGGGGNDVYYVDNLGDVIVESANGGADAAVISVSGYTLAANVEVAAVQGVGLTLTGNSSSNILYGASGADTLNGGDGDDTLQGGAGADAMNGGLGNDTFYVAQAGDTVVENNNEGFDATIVQMTTAYTLADNVEVGATFLGSGVTITGNGLDNLLYGNAGADTLNGAGGNDFIQGAGGNDTMAGGTGNDTYFIEDAGDVITENANEGIDAAIVFTSSYTLAANVEVGARFLTTAYTLTGNALDNQLYGNNGADTLNGGDGNDTIQGGGGNDTMVGGLGNDTYLVEQAGDIVTENANEGSDAVIVLIGSYTLAANVEVGATFLTTGVSITGNSLDNRLYGNSGADTLSGAAGADLLDGGAGADTLTGGSENDVFMFVAGQANGDTITDFTGNGAASGDVMRFAGYGTAAGGATFVQIDATHWQINSADGLVHDTITLANGAGVDAGDWVFI